MSSKLFKSKSVDLEEDGVLDIDTLKQFTIPKRKKAKTELLELVSETSHEYQHDILQTIRRSYRGNANLLQFAYSRPRLVHNKLLLDEFIQRKKDMRTSGYAEKDMIETFAFQAFNTDSEARRVCESGLETRANKPSVACLGNPTMGVYVCKHADVISAKPLRSGQSGVLVIFKIVKGRVKLLRERGSVDLEPTPNFDCHQLKPGSIDAPSVPPQEVYELSQMYLYEYNEDSDISSRPRQIVPYAVVDYHYGNFSRDDARRHTKAARTSSSKSDSQQDDKNIASSNFSSAGDNSRAPLRSNRAISSAKKPRYDPVPPETINFPAAGDGAISPLATTGSLVRIVPLLDLVFNRMRGSDGVPPNNNNVDNAFVNGFVPMYDQSQTSLMNFSPARADAMAAGAFGSFEQRTFGDAEFFPFADVDSRSTETPPTLAELVPEPLHDPVCEPAPEPPPETIPEEEPREPPRERVIWSGDVAVNGATICTAELSSHCSVCFEFGTPLNLSSKLSLTSIRCRYLSRLADSRFEKTRESYAGGLFFVYCMLRPTGTDCSQLDRFIAYLIKSKAAGFIEYPNKRILLLLPNSSDLVAEFGLKCENSPSIVLHCFLVSSESCIKLPLPDIDEPSDELDESSDDIRPPSSSPLTLSPQSRILLLPMPPTT